MERAKTVFAQCYVGFSTKYLWFRGTRLVLASHKSDSIAVHERVELIHVTLLHAETMGSDDIVKG